jgi:phage tail sheath gpL-like
MSLTGTDPNDPTPSDRREIILGAGDSLGGSTGRLVLFYGNKTSAGSEPLETLGTQVLHDQDARDRMGPRSELYQDYRVFVAVNPDAPIFFIAVTEPSSGSPAAATIPFTFAGGSASDSTTVDIFWGGRQTSFAVAAGDSVTVQAAAAKAAINSADEGTWPMTADNASGVLTVSASQLGDRGDYYLQNMRIVARRTVTTTITKGSLTAGVGTDDFTTALDVASKAGEYYYQISPKYGTSAPTATDNGVGEHIAMIAAQAAPINGKGQCAIFGLTGTQAQATTVATAAACNAPRAFFFHAKNSDWSPGMIAAHHAAVMRLGQTAHPSANLTGYANSDSTPYQVPPPFAATDKLTAAEIKADLNSGVSPVGFSALGAGKLIRHITSKSLVPGTTTNDFRVREGHIPSAIDFFWEELQRRYLAQRQPFLAADPPQGVPPLPKVTYPRAVRALVIALIDELVGPNPLGIYEGPILDPDKAAQMRASVQCTLIPGGIRVRVNPVAVQHNNKTETEIREVSAPQ